ncbi:MAG TPA: S41 family peptidase [Steroidobacteraceae bacterium]|nr:S41 family peptidase [Steroidobacteraceae bacterium]
MTRPLRVAMLLALGGVAGFGLSLGPAVKADRNISQANAKPARVARVPVERRDERLLSEVLERVRQDYVDELSDQELVDAAIRGVMSKLDPHSTYLDTQQFDEIRISTSGEYSGVGIEVALEKNKVKVVKPIEDAPAARAGVLAGDAILAVDDVAVDTTNINDVIDRMRGKVGSTVKLTLERAGLDAPMDLQMKRAEVQVHSVASNLLSSGFGYASISHFSETTTADLERAIAAMKRQNGGSLQGLVLDLRNNPGGVLEAAVGVSDLFLDDGIIVTADGRAPDAKFEMDAQPGDLLDGAPVIVLVNSGSASASEIVAGALKDHHRATLLGQQTYGKGSVQTVMPLSDGHALKLTTSKYFTPSGVSIHGKGITPDVLVDEKELSAHLNKDGDAAADLGVSDVVHKDYEVQLAMDLLKKDQTQPKIRQSSLN